MFDFLIGILGRIISSLMSTAIVATFKNSKHRKDRHKHDGRF